MSLASGMSRTPGHSRVPSPPTSAHGEPVEPSATVLRQAQDERVFNFHNFEKALATHAYPLRQTKLAYCHCEERSRSAAAHGEPV